MNHVLSVVRDARTSSDPVAVPCSEPVLTDLLTLHEEMIVQLHLEQLGAAATADSLARVIDQHEKASALLRALLEDPLLNSA